MNLSMESGKKNPSNITSAVTPRSSGLAFWFPLAVILQLALLLRTVPLTYSHFWDEAVFLQNTKVITEGRTNYFDMPAGAVSATISHLFAAKGYLTTDAFNFGIYQPAPLSRGLVSITFDDGWTSQYTNAFPLLKKYGLASTFYIISGELTNQPDYMTVPQIKALQTAGHEIASHSVSHRDLTTDSATQLTNEMKTSQATLQTQFDVKIPHFAYPYGAYNAKTITEGLIYYQSQRSTDTGYNTIDNLNLTTLKVQNIDSTTTPAQVQDWVDQAAHDKTWLILVYHEVATTPVGSDPLYNTKPTDLDAVLQTIKNSGLGVLTIDQAIKEVLPQIGK
jgi:peptidoglycan/xylan/chitin deacetylase (PgdA/CDA1 family)